VLFLKVNVDVHRGLAQYFSVNAIPTIFIINDKSVVKAFPGLQTKEMYAAALDEVLAAAAAAKKVPAPVPAK
jgi:thioredoxin-like negative regulator of GroEL